MFSIGLFSTYLPYVLLAMFYGLYVGVHSIMKVESDSGIDETKLAVKTIFKDASDPQTGEASTNFYYDQFFGEETSSSDPVFHQFSGRTIRIIPHEDPVFQSYYHPLFSRPPPAVSL